MSGKLDYYKTAIPYSRGMSSLIRSQKQTTRWWNHSMVLMCISVLWQGSSEERPSGTVRDLSLPSFGSQHASSHLGNSSSASWNVEIAKHTKWPPSTSHHFQCRRYRLSIPSVAGVRPRLILPRYWQYWCASMECRPECTVKYCKFQLLQWQHWLESTTSWFQVDHWSCQM